MTTYEPSIEYHDSDNVIWQHLDYYVRRQDGELVLVQTLLKQVATHESQQTEISTFYIALDDLDEEWAEAVLEQGDHLEEGKSCDFVPPDEMIVPLDDENEY